MISGMAYKYNTEEDKSIIPLIGLLVILIIVVGGVLFFLLSNPKEIENPIIIPNGTKIDNKTTIIEVNDTLIPCDDQCIFEGAIIDGNYDQCKLIGNSSLKEECFLQLSDISLPACLEVDDKEKRSFCIYAFAVQNNDIDLCDLVEYNKEDCIKKIDPCYKETNENLCRALLKSDPDLCEKNTECLMNYSLTKKDYESCRMIQNEVFSKGCESAIRRSDKCSDLDLISERDYCYQIYATNSDDYSTCSSISYGSIYKLNCLSMFAASEKDLSICNDDKLPLDDLWACYTNYSLISKDISGCYEIHQLANTNKFRCAFEFAKLHGDPSACQAISSLPTRDTCYQGAIIYSNENLDPTTCKFVTDFNWRNKCYNEGAILKSNVLICEEIEEEFAREACKSAYENRK